jgi:hypothetical protein
MWQSVDTIGVPNIISYQIHTITHDIILMKSVILCNKGKEEEKVYFCPQMFWLSNRLLVFSAASLNQCYPTPSIVLSLVWFQLQNITTQAACVWWRKYKCSLLTFLSPPCFYPSTRQLLRVCSQACSFPRQGLGRFLVISMAL